MNRIKFLREENTMTQQELADKLGGAKSSVAMYENEERKPSLEVLLKLSEIFNCSIDYILGKADAKYNEQYEMKEYYIPVLGIVKAGYNYLAEENIIGYVSINDNSLKNEDFFALEVKGNSMEPIIYEKDIAIVKKQDDFENGDIVVALINGEEATIKKAYKNDKGIVLQPANPMIEPLIFSKDQIINLPVRIIGIVYNITRKFK